MKRGAEYNQIIDKKSGTQYNLHTIVGSGGFTFGDKPRGTHVVKNPKFNNEPEYLFFKQEEVEPVYPEKSNTAWYESQKKKQDEAFSKGDPIYPD